MKLQHCLSISFLIFIIFLQHHHVSCHAFRNSMFSFNNQLNDIQTNFQNNFRNFWHFPSSHSQSSSRWRPFNPGYKPRFNPESTTTTTFNNNNNNNVDSGLTSPPQVGRVNAADWNQVKRSKTNFCCLF